MSILETIIETVDSVGTILGEIIPVIVNSGGFTTDTQSGINQVSNATSTLSTITGIPDVDPLSNVSRLSGYVNNVIGFIGNVVDTFSTKVTPQIVDSQLISGVLDEFEAIGKVQDYITDSSGVILVDKAQKGLNDLKIVYTDQVEQMSEKVENTTFHDVNIEDPKLNNLDDEFFVAEDVVNTLAVNNSVVVCNYTQVARPEPWIQDKTTVLRVYHIYQEDGDVPSSSPDVVGSKNMDTMDLDYSYGWNVGYDNDGSHKTFRIDTSAFKGIGFKNTKYTANVNLDVKLRLFDDAFPTSIGVKLGSDEAKLWVGSGNSDDSKLMTESFDLRVIGGDISVAIQMRAPYDGQFSWFDLYLQSTTNAALVTCSMVIDVVSASIVMSPITCGCECELIEYYDKDGILRYVDRDTTWLGSIYGKLNRESEQWTDPNFSVNTLYKQRVVGTNELDVITGAIKVYSDTYLPMDGVDEKYKQYSTSLEGVSFVGDWIYSDGPLKDLTLQQKLRLMGFLRNDIINTGNGRFLNSKLGETIDDIVA